VWERKNEQRLKVMDPWWCVHAKNEIVYVLMNQPSIFEQVQGEQNSKKKIIQSLFISIYSTSESHLLTMKITNSCFFFFF
jgi:hypothetical protein